MEGGGGGLVAEWCRAYSGIRPTVTSGSGAAAMSVVVCVCVCACACACGVRCVRGEAGRW